MFAKSLALLPYLCTFLALVLGTEKMDQNREEKSLVLDSIMEGMVMIKDEVKEIGNTTVNAIKVLEDLKHDLEILKTAAKVPDHCQPCDCNPMGSMNDTCDPLTRNCICFQRYVGRLCNHCKNGFFNFPKCMDCQCNAAGTYGAVCDKESGECFCKDNFKGDKCNECKDDNVAGPNCDRCNANYFGFPKCKSCMCHPSGSTGHQCDLVTGQCPCSERYRSLHCDSCLEGRFGFPDCQGIYNENATGPEFLVVEGHYISENRNRYSYSTHSTKMYRYLEATNSKGKLSGTATVKSIEGISLSKNQVTELTVSNFGFDYQMTAIFNGSCVLCKKHEQSFNQCKGLTPKISSGGVTTLETTSIPAPEFAVDEWSFLIGMESGAYNIRSDYYVDAMIDITQPWKAVRGSSFSLVDKFGEIQCAAKLNDTTVVGLSGRRYNGKLDNLILVFFDVQESRWKPGSRVSHFSSEMKAIINCQMSSESTLLVEMVPSSTSEPMLFCSIDIEGGFIWDSDWYGIKGDFQPSWGTLVRYNNGVLYVGGASDNDTKALLYKHKVSSKWSELNIRLNRERVLPAICAF